MVSTYGPKIDSLIESVREDVDEIDLSEPYPEDRASEIADQAVPIYNSELFALAPELLGYEISDRGLLPDDADIVDHIKVSVYDILSNEAHQCLYRRQHDEEEG